MLLEEFSVADFFPGWYRDANDQIEKKLEVPNKYMLFCCCCSCGRGFAFAKSPRYGGLFQKCL